MSHTALRSKVLADIREALSNKLGFFERQLEHLGEAPLHNRALHREVKEYAETFINESKKLLELVR